MKKLKITTSVTKKHPFEVTHLDAYIKDLPKVFENYKIAHLTDFHFGICTPPNVIEKAVEIVCEIKPSVICLTGDYVQVSATGITHILATKVSPKLFKWKEYRRDVRKLAKEFARIIKPLNPADGIYGVFGNHDYHEGIGTIKRQFPKTIKWLVNESIQIEKNNSKISISGIDDYKFGKPSINKTVLNHKNKTAFDLLLAHNPDVFTTKGAEKLDRFNLTLCGHTHGGQICLPGRKPIITRTSQKEHCSGLSYKNENAIYVSRGVGCGGLPLRIFCPAEILIITLKHQH